MDGTMDVRDLFKEAVAGRGRNYLSGTSSKDALAFFKHVANKHWARDKSILKYSFKRLSHNDAWSIDDLLGNLCTQGKYILFGATRKNNDSHKSQLDTILSQKSETDKLSAWNKAKTLANDHAIGVEVDDNMQGYIYDNGCVSGRKKFSIDNLATRMRCINAIFIMELGIKLK